jgi:hypothetical protein
VSITQTPKTAASIRATVYAESPSVSTEGWGSSWKMDAFDLLLVTSKPISLTEKKVNDLEPNGFQKFVIIAVCLKSRAVAQDRSPADGFRASPTWDDLGIFPHRSQTRYSRDEMRREEERRWRVRGSVFMPCRRNRRACLQPERGSDVRRCGSFNEGSCG